MKTKTVDVIRLFWRVLDSTNQNLKVSADLDRRRRLFIDELMGARLHQPSFEHFDSLHEEIVFGSVDIIRVDLVRQLAQVAASKFNLVAIEVSEPDVWPTGQVE